MTKQKEVSDLIASSLTIVSDEIDRLKALAKSQGLEQSDAQCLTAYIRALVSVDKNNRQVDIEQEIASWDDAKLKEEADRAYKFLQQNKEIEQDEDE